MSWNCNAPSTPACCAAWTPATASDRQRQAEIHQLRQDTSADVAGLSEEVTRIQEVLRRHGIDPAASTSSGATGETVPAAR